jgi:hypothetical protein
MQNALSLPSDRESDAMSGINLQPFCLDDESDRREYLKSPFTQGGFTYATDGRFLVRVPAINGIGPMVGNTIAVEKVIPGIDDVDTFRSLAGIQLPAPTRPDQEEIRCTSCGGRGTEHSCPDCECECEDCGGSGKATRKLRVSVDLFGLTFDVAYVRKLLMLPDVEVAPQTALAGGGYPGPMFFRFTGGRGAVMPLYSKYEEHIELEVAA